MAVAVIKGMQSEGVIATAKHYMGNNQEYDRHEALRVRTSTSARCARFICQH